MRTKRGFTLLEVMVSVALMGVIMTLIWSSSSQTLRSKERTESRDLVFHAGQVALRKIADDVSAAFLTKRATTQGTGAQQTTTVAAYKTFFIGEDRGDQDSLRFTSLAHVRLVKDSKECDQTRIAYEVVPHPRQARLFNVIRKEQPWLDDTTDVEGRAFALLEGILSFNVEYYDERKREWVKEWDADKADWRDKLPMAVRVKLVFPDPDGGDQDVPLSTAVTIAMWEGPIEL